MDRKEILKKVIEVIKGVNESVEEVKETQTLKDIGFDDLDMIEFIMGLEEDLGVEIPDEDADKFTTVESVVNYLDAKINPSKESAKE
jgi:acyl carrier protein